MNSGNLDENPFDDCDDSHLDHHLSPQTTYLHLELRLGLRISQSTSIRPSDPAKTIIERPYLKIRQHHPMSQHHPKTQVNITHSHHDTTQRTSRIHTLMGTTSLLPASITRSRRLLHIYRFPTTHICRIITPMHHHSSQHLLRTTSFSTYLRRFN